MHEYAFGKRRVREDSSQDSTVLWFFKACTLRLK